MVNIVYIHSHDTGRYVQPYGYSIPTPAIQSLAEEGTLFRKAFCANPTCSPSRASLLTGQWPHSCGMGGLVNRGWSLPNPQRLLPNFLREHGYATVRAGIQHVVKNPDEGGYSRILEGEKGDLIRVSILLTGLKKGTKITSHVKGRFKMADLASPQSLCDGFVIGYYDKKYSNLT